MDGTKERMIGTEMMKPIVKRIREAERLLEKMKEVKNEL